MSKLDQLRRQREEQSERQEEQARTPGIRAKTAPVVAPAAAPATRVTERRASSTAEALEGACSVCGKTKALNGGLVSSHQKGLGKMCPGSRKEPA